MILYHIGIWVSKLYVPLIEIKVFFKRIVLIMTTGASLPCYRLLSVASFNIVLPSHVFFPPFNNLKLFSH